MPQFARPIQDIFNSNWENQSGAVPNTYQSVDEVSVNDADFARTRLSPNNDVVVWKLSPVTDPGVSTGHIMRVRYGKDTTGGDTIDLSLEFRQNYVSEVSQGTLIGAINAGNVPGGFIDFIFELPGAMADLITDYSSLFVRFIAKKV